MFVCLFEYTPSPQQRLSQSSQQTRTLYSHLYINIRHTIHRLQTIVCNQKTAKNVCTIKCSLFYNYLSKIRKQYTTTGNIQHKGVQPQLRKATTISRVARLFFAMGPNQSSKKGHSTYFGAKIIEPPFSQPKTLWIY